MNHGGMDHGGHGGMDHGGKDAGSASCSMNMVWNYDTRNLCILSSSWRITTPLSLYTSLVIIALAAMLYEWLRLYIRQLDARLARVSITSPLLSATHRRRASLLPTSSAPSSGSSAAVSDRRSVSMSKRRASNTSISLTPTRQPWIKPLETTRIVQTWRSTLYATSILISFLLMLISMTFNAYVIAAIVIGELQAFRYCDSETRRRETKTDQLMILRAPMTGAACGHYWFNRDLSSSGALLGGATDDKGLACHM